MAEFIGTEEKVIDVDEPVIFENKKVAEWKERMMPKFDPLRFIADHAGLSLADAILEAYRQGQQDAQHIFGTNDGDTISRQAAKLKVARVIWEDGDSCDDFHDKCVDCLNDVPSTSPESYKVKLKEIADALSEKFAYMNTCLNERDIILGYLGVKRRCETHCNTDCTNTKCESHPLSSAQSYTEDEVQKMQDLESSEIEKAFQLGREDALSEIVRCKDCKYWDSSGYCVYGSRLAWRGNYNDYCSCAKRREG